MDPGSSKPATSTTERVVRAHEEDTLMETVESEGPAFANCSKRCIFQRRRRLQRRRRHYMRNRARSPKFAFSFCLLITVTTFFIYWLVKYDIKSNMEKTSVGTPLLTNSPLLTQDTSKMSTPSTSNLTTPSSTPTTTSITLTTTTTKPTTTTSSLTTTSTMSKVVCARVGGLWVHEHYCYKFETYKNGKLCEAPLVPSTLFLREPYTVLMDKIAEYLNTPDGQAFDFIYTGAFVFCAFDDTIDRIIYKENSQEKEIPKTKYNQYFGFSDGTVCSKFSSDLRIVIDDRGKYSIEPFLGYIRPVQSLCEAYTY